MEFRVRRCEKAHLAPRNSASTRIPKSRPTWSSRCEIHTGECDLMQRMSSLDGTGRAARAALGLTDLRPSSRTLPPRLAVLADERLAWLVARGSKRALSTLYERYESQLYAYCYLLPHENDDAYDALQATFTRALVALRRGQRDGLVRPWLFRLAREEAISLERDREVANRVRQTPVTF